MVKARAKKHFGRARVCCFVMALPSVFMIWKSGLFTASEEMLVAIKHGKREPAFVSIMSESQQPLEAASDLRGTERE